MSSAEAPVVGSREAALKRASGDGEDLAGDSPAKRARVDDDDDDEDTYGPALLGYRRISSRDVSSADDLTDNERSLLEEYLDLRWEALPAADGDEVPARPSLDELVFSKLDGGGKCVVEKLALDKAASPSSTYLAITVGLDLLRSGAGLQNLHTAVCKPSKATAGEWQGVLFGMIDYCDLALYDDDGCDPALVNDLRRALTMPTDFDLVVTKDKHCEEAGELTDSEKKLLVAAVKHHRQEDDTVDLEALTSAAAVFGNDEFIDDSMCQFYYFQEVRRAEDGSSTTGHEYVRVGFGMGGVDHSTVFEDDNDRPLFTDYGWVREDRGNSKEDMELYRAFQYFISLQNQDDYDDEEEGDGLPTGSNADEDEDGEEEECGGDDDDEEDDEEEEDDDDGAP